MNRVVAYKTYNSPPISEKEIMRYAGVRKASPETLELMHSALNELDKALSYKVCYCELPIITEGDICNFGEFTLQSRDLAKTFKNAKSVILFAATIGVEIDRLIMKYGRLSPAKGLMLQAIGTERIESLCNFFCQDIKAERNVGLTPRFSPGYGDLSISAQKDLFKILDCEKKIGLTLNDSLLMSPTKSVTAFVGITECDSSQGKCSSCCKTDCIFRGEI